MYQDTKNNFLATAFVSCSLRPEDKPFIDFIERILLAHQIKSIGTIGIYSAAPVNPAAHMRINIPQADFVVIVATPRYFQKDLQTGQLSNGLSEMVHVEAGIAYAFNKPVVVFVKEGTSVGNFLPNITEYIILNGYQTNLEQKWSLINNLINNTFQITQMNKENTSSANLKKIITGGLAILGGLKLLETITEEGK